jgi:hypothetical protein
VPEEAEPVPPLVRGLVPVPERLRLVRARARRMVHAWRPVRVLRLVRPLRLPGREPSPVR